MKKTLITLLALGSVVRAEIPTTVLTFQTDDLSFSTDKWALNGVGNGPGASWQGSATLSDGTVATMKLKGGKFWDYETVTSSWTNTAALTAMNADLHTSITAADLVGIKFDSSAAGGATSDLTLNFSNNTGYHAGQNIVFYLLVAVSSYNNTDPYNNFTVTGLDNSSVSWATADGDGFNTTAIDVPVANLAMIKVEGKLTESVVFFKSTSEKNGWAMVAYAPEPATATLSLLALAGLAARRRRH